MLWPLKKVRKCWVKTRQKLESASAKFYICVGTRSVSLARVFIRIFLTSGNYV
ncbi:hypothetical protein S7335_3438 [Synechococcus sp. PCC 7335]|nr:hypothetical protein S7335_3438 [Synechococcus sp. PCC 7335]